MVELSAEERVRGTDWAAAHELLLERRRAQEPRAWSERRRAALERFLAHGYPTRRSESWRYTDVSPIATTVFDAAGGPPAGRVDAPELERAVLPGAHPIAFVDGTYAAGISSDPLPEGVEVASLAALLAGDAGEGTPLGSVAREDGRPFAALNTAFFEDGALVRVAPGTVLPRPIQLLFVATGGGTVRAVHPRVVIELGRGAQATVVESFAGSAGARLTNAVTEIRVGEGAVLDHHRVQREGTRTWHLGVVAAELERDATLRSSLFSLGGAIARTEIDVAFRGEGGEAELDGLWVVDGGRHADCQTFVDHAVPRCSSRQGYRGVVGDRAHGVFRGRVLVREHAQHTDAGQWNRNLLLSRDARADTKPELEIHADDVKCAHGATVGQLEAEPLFYLRSRGIDERTARRILTVAFADVPVARVAFAPLRERLAAALEEAWGGGS